VLLLLLLSLPPLLLLLLLLARAAAFKTPTPTPVEAGDAATRLEGELSACRGESSAVGAEAAQSSLRSQKPVAHAPRDPVRLHCRLAPNLYTPYNLLMYGAPCAAS
jgi:hypothetical protein